MTEADKYCKNCQAELGLQHLDGPSDDYVQGIADAVNYYLSDSPPSAIKLRMSHGMRIAKGRINPAQLAKMLGTTT